MLINYIIGLIQISIYCKVKRQDFLRKFSCLLINMIFVKVVSGGNVSNYISKEYYSSKNCKMSRCLHILFNSIQKHFIFSSIGNSKYFLFKQGT